MNKNIMEEFIKYVKQLMYEITRVPKDRFERQKN